MSNSPRAKSSKFKSCELRSADTDKHYFNEKRLLSFLIIENFSEKRVLMDSEDTYSSQEMEDEKTESANESPNLNTNSKSEQEYTRTISSSFHSTSSLSRGDEEELTEESYPYVNREKQSHNSERRKRSQYSYTRKHTWDNHNQDSSCPDPETKTSNERDSRETTDLDSNSKRKVISFCLTPNGKPAGAEEEKEEEKKEEKKEVEDVFSETNECQVACKFLKGFYGLRHEND